MSITRVLPICNSIAVGVLTFMVVVLFSQLHRLESELSKELEAVGTLQKQVQEKQQGQIQQLTRQVQDEHSLTVIQMAGTFTLFTCILTAFHMYNHLGQYNNPIVQRKVIAILWMSPIYAVTSFLGLLLPAADAYLAVLKDFYEAYVIYNFLGFLVAVLGREGAVRVLASNKHHLSPPSRFLRVFYEQPPESSPDAMANAIVTECQILALQFVFVRPLTSLASFVCTTIQNNNRHAHPEQEVSSSWTNYFSSPFFIIDLITNISVFCAFTGLLKFYHAVRDQIGWLQPFSKFMAIKGVVFLTFWQGLAIDIMVYLQTPDPSSSNNNNAGAASTQNSALTYSSSSEGSLNDYPSEYGNSTTFMSTTAPLVQAAATYTNNNSYEMADDPAVRAAEIQNILICLEMLFFAIAHWCVFPAEEWVPGYQPKQYAKPGLGLSDFVSDVTHIVSGPRQRRRQRRRQRVSQRSDEEEDEFTDDGTTYIPDGLVVSKMTPVRQRTTTAGSEDDLLTDDSEQSGSFVNVPREAAPAPAVANNRSGGYLRSTSMNDTVDHDSYVATSPAASNNHIYLHSTLDDIPAHHDHDDDADHHPHANNTSAVLTVEAQLVV